MTTSKSEPEYSDFSNVESQRNDLTAEEFPEALTARAWKPNRSAKAPLGEKAKTARARTVTKTCSSMKVRAGTIRPKI
ncbi:hypothetical protein CM49_00915 [Paenibacillus sp. P1XP2]|nr:hypothetical protein CM49_00915 [Paenibacillus sp. P1XP2]